MNISYGINGSNALKPHVSAARGSVTCLSQTACQLEPSCYTEVEALLDSGQGAPFAATRREKLLCGLAFAAGVVALFAFSFLL